MNHRLPYYIGDWENVKWTATKSDFLGPGGNFSKVLLIRMHIFAKIAILLVFQDSQRLFVYCYWSINDIYGWNINRRPENCQNLANLNNFDFFCFLNEPVSIWTIVHCTGLQDWLETMFWKYLESVYVFFRILAILRNRETFVTQW